MSDLMEKALNWLEALRKKHLSVPVIYRRGKNSVELPSTIGKTIFKIQDEYGRIVHYESRDYLISSSELVIKGAVTTPQKGDEIIENGFIYEVMAPANEPEWRYSDTYRNTLRIHTKNTGRV